MKFDKIRAHTKHDFKVRMCEYFGILHSLGKKVKGDVIKSLKIIFYSAIAHLILKIS